MQHAYAVNNAYALSTSAAGLDPGPGPGWFGVQDGYLLGDPAGTPLFRGTMGMLTNRRLRAGRRRLGDQFRDATTVTTITSDTFGADNCYRGEPWSVFLGRTAGVGNPTLGFPAVVCEPTANGPAPAAGGKVFKCIRDHLVANPQPNWAAAVAVGDPVQVGGLDTWELIGWTPQTVVTRGAGGGQTINAADLTGQGAAAPVNLLLPDGMELTLDDNRSYSVGVRILGSKTVVQAAASVVYELLVFAQAGALTIATNLVSTHNAPAWGFAFTNPAGLTLRLTCTPNLDTVNFVARVEWTSLPGV